MWALILHGGAKKITSDAREANEDGCRAAAKAGVAILIDGGSSIDGVETAVRHLESDPTFNAGYGSVQNSEGNIEMCAAIMKAAVLSDA